MRRTVQNLLKIAACGATVFGLGFAFLTYYPDVDPTQPAGVEEARADIFALDTAPRTSTQRFEATLDELGHTRPQVYDYNGNTIFFSSRETDESPRDLLYEYQEAFVRNGVNEQEYVDMLANSVTGQQKYQELQPYIEQRWTAMLSGQIVPLTLTDDYLSMGGGVIAGHPTTSDEVVAQMRKRGGAKFENLFEGFRHVEAFRGANGKTHVTATWSQDDVDIRKHLPQYRDRNLEGAKPDLTVPACPGCQRLTRFEGMKRTKPYVTNVFDSPQRGDTVASFYRQALGGRGWAETPSSVVTRRALQYTIYRDDPVRMLQFARGDQFLTVQVDPDTAGSLVTTTQSD